MSLFSGQNLVPIGAFEIVDFLPFENSGKNETDGFRVGDYLQEKVWVKSNHKIKAGEYFWLVVLEIRKYLCTENGFSVWFVCRTDGGENIFVPLKNVCRHARKK